MRQVTVEVTQEDIDSGMPKICSQCPVALAMRRAEGRVWMVGYGVLELLQAPYSVVTAPTGVTQFISDFDRNNPVAPFSFTINLPE
jgi:hypothetical protein